MTADVERRFPLLTPGMVVAGVGGALGGVGVAHMVVGAVNGSFLVEGIEDIVPGMAAIASWAAPVIVLFGVPIAMLLELVTRKRPVWAAGITYGVVGAGLGLFIQQFILRGFPVAFYGAAAALTGKASIEWYRRSRLLGRQRIAKKRELST